MLFEKILKISGKIYVAVPLASMIFFVSCEKSTHSVTMRDEAKVNAIVESTQQAAKINATFSGEDYFRAIFFGSGPVVQYIPEIDVFSANSFTNQAALAEVYRIQDSLLALIKAQNPSFFAHFKNDIRSGDQIDIRNAINLGASKLVPIIQSYQKKQTEEHKKLAQQKIEELTVTMDPNDLAKTKAAVEKVYNDLQGLDLNAIGRGACLVIVWVIFIFIWCDIAIFTDYWVINNSIFDLLSANSSNPKDGLMKNKMINSIAVNLKK